MAQISSGRRRLIRGGIAFLGLAAVSAAAGGTVMTRPDFGGKPEGERLRRMMASPHWAEGQFQNLDPMAAPPADRSQFEIMSEFLFDRNPARFPVGILPHMKTNLAQLPQNQFVWLGHSGFFLRMEGVSVIIDPALHQAFPLPGFYKPFPGADAYQPQDLPAADLLVITHDHYDHLDYETVRELKRLTGRVVGINLEPCDLQAAKSNDGTLWKMSGGRLATVENARRAAEMGVDLIVLTGNPGNGVSNELIVEALKAISAAVGDRVLLAAGKMHASGVAGEGGEKIMTPADAEAFMAAGADIILLPAPGTVPGITQEYAHRLIEVVHSRGKLALTAIGTSQEGADVATIRQIALMCKMAGADIHHIGDTGVPGMALPQNIMAYSIAIRGERHTYHKMAQSVNR